MDYRNNANELTHHGILGQKWGVRRYQNKDGTLTPAGKRKADRMKEKYTKLTGKRLIRKPSKNKSIDEDSLNKDIKDMTIAELTSRTNRLNAEKNYMEAVNNRKALDPKTTSKGKAFVDLMLKEVVAPAATDVAKQVVKSYLVKATNDGLKLDDELKVYTNNKKK